MLEVSVLVFFFQAEDGIRDLVRSRGLGDVYKRQQIDVDVIAGKAKGRLLGVPFVAKDNFLTFDSQTTCLLYTSDAADERSSVDLGGRRIIKKKNK